MERRLALALALSLGILVGFQVLFPQKPREAAPPAATSAPASPLAAGSDVAVASPSASAPADPGRIVEVASRLFRARFASQGGRLIGFELSEYQKDPAPGDGPYDLVHANGSVPLALVWRSENGSIVDDRSVLYEITASSERAIDAPAVVTMTGRTSGGATITKTLTLRPDSYVLDFKVETQGLAVTPLAVGWSRSVRAPTSQGGIEGAVGYFDNSLHSFDSSTLEEPEVVEGLASWAGYAEHYFLAAFVLEQRQPMKLVASSADGASHAVLWTAAPASALHYGLYIGPKSFRDLEKAGGGDLVHAIDLGWFWFVAKPLFVALQMIHGVLGNWGWAIILLTVAVRLAFYPVNKKQIEAMKGMQAIQPEVKRIQERYASDREKMNVEMMELYRRHKVNPLAGCLPMLVQLPVFIGLYNVLMQSIELRHAPFVGWMHDLSQPDRLGALHIPFVEPAGIPVMTLLMGASMMLQQKMTPSTADPQQQRIMMIMPVVFTVMFVNFPAGLVLYWLSNNVLSIAQQWISNRQAA